MLNNVSARVLVNKKLAQWVKMLHPSRHLYAHSMCRVGVFIVNFEHISHLCSSVPFVNFEHVIAGWDQIVSLPVETPLDIVLT